ncbi:hypothetical protein KKP04_08590 [Rhodomicrobium sp. Az07]|uniref:hypothetical protein n=1 Tax=Rhodomicrobium sp. Az07 TaxID=2839034 RepID=UPI001BE7EDF2|nr:hypothetical protein [Rhodomicrobium sp. Az07]MBT3070923.1 hypothetical protein [Rhodomicrobium sp. Az07]
MTLPDDGRHPAASSVAAVNGHHSAIPLSRVYLPFAMVLTFGGFLVVAGYTVGGVMSGIARDKTETDTRLSAIEKEMTAIKNILADRSLCVRPK